MKKASNFRKIGMIFVLIMLCTIILNPISNAQQFSDLRPDHWCYNKIIDFEERGYVTGYDDGEFKPDRTITRAEYVTIVNNFFGYEANTENTAKFSDVSDEDWFEPYVSEAVKRGYISGYPDGTFKPYDPIRRQEATVILSKILNIADEEYEKDHEDGLAQYADGEEVEDWAYKAVHSYSVYNFINGYEDNTIRLFRNVTRAETVQLLNTVEEKVVIDRDNKTNEIKDRPSGGHKKRTATPVITVVEANDQNPWYNGLEVDRSGNVTVKVTTTTKNATITVKVNGKVIDTTPFETEGSGVTFTLPEGKYEIIASAKRSSYKVSYDAKGEVDVDITKPVVSGKLNPDETVTLSAYDNLSGIDSIQYAWFVKDGEDYKRVSNWEEIKDYINLPADAQNYYIGVKGSDIAGNKIDGNLKDDNIDDAKVTDGATNEPYDIVKEPKVADDKDKEQDQEDKPSANEFKITYHKNDGTGTTYVQKLNEGETVLKSDIFGRKEYKLIGWAEIATGDKVYELGETVNFNEDKDLYAVWKLNEPGDEPVIVEVKLTVKFISGENGSLEGEAETKVVYGAEWNTVTVPTPKANDGYCFDKWEPELPAKDAKVTSDLVYTAKFKANQYTITFDTDGGSAIAPITQDYGTEVTKPADPTKTGYTFDGWDKEIPSTMPAENMTIKASWKKDESQTKEMSYTVEYYKDSEHVDKDDVVVSKTVWVNDTTLKVDTVETSDNKYLGYKFDHTEPTTIPEEIADKGIIKVYYTKDESQTKEISYTVEYYKDSEHVDKDDVVVSKTVWINDTTLKVDTVETLDNKYLGYKFDHTEPTTIPEEIADKGIIKVYYTKDASQTKEMSYTVEYYKDSEHVDKDDVVVSKTVWINDTTLKVDTVEKSDNKYLGYKFDHTDPATIPGEVESNSVIKVYYVVNQYTITFDTDGGSAIAPITQAYGTKVIKPADPTKTGYKFIGWDKEVPSTMPAKDMTITAKWEKNSKLEAKISCEYPTSEGIKAEPGDKVAYEITLNSETSNVTLPTEIKIELDPRVELVRTSLPSNATYDSETNTITWKVSNIDDKLSYDVKIDTDIPAGSKITTKIIEGATAINNVIDIESTVVIKQAKDKNIILVLDVSGSMDYCVKHNEDFVYEYVFTGPRGHRDGFLGLGFKECNEKTRLDALKFAAKNFVADVCDGRESENITITIITFANDAKTVGTFYNPTVEELNKSIDKLSAEGGTNIKGAVKAATTVLNSDEMLKDAVNYAIILSDGEPNANQYYCDNETLNNFRKTNVNAYAIGLGDSYLEEELLKIVNNDKSKLYDASREEELETAFDEIGSILNETQTTKGIIEVDITNIVVYPIKLSYKDTTLKTITVKDVKELETNNLSINGNSLIWDISKYPGCRNFKIEVNKEGTISSYAMEKMMVIKTYAEEIVLEYGDPELNDNMEETEIEEETNKVEESKEQPSDNSETPENVVEPTEETTPDDTDGTVDNSEIPEQLDEEPEIQDDEPKQDLGNQPAQDGTADNDEVLGEKEEPKQPKEVTEEPVEGTIPDDTDGDTDTDKIPEQSTADSENQPTQGNEPTNLDNNQPSEQQTDKEEIKPEN